MEKTEQLKQAALDYHRADPPGKIRVAPTKALVSQRDLSLAYSPGVAFACDAIVADANAASEMTARGNLVAVITNGTAVLGLGDIGPLAAKPVMEGKGVLFQKFAGIDVFDIEISERDPDKLVEIIAALEPTFGGVNLEDIKAPECFIVERKLRERMKVPVFHDDQHGTAIIVGAAVLNALEVVGKKIEDVKLATAGAGAAGIACLDMLVALGLKPENILAFDRGGVLHQERSDLDPDKQRYARQTDKRDLAGIVDGADIFLGLSAGGVLKPEMVATMAAQPVILALANPNPEILPEDAKKVRPDCIIATGRSDYPNQVNNALCFPYIFRGALDVGATTINEDMKLACVRAIAALARRESSDVASNAYGGQCASFGPDFLIPQPFDPRLLVELAPAVAQAAMDSGIAARPIQDMPAYREKLWQFVFRTGLMMKPVFVAAKRDLKRVMYAEGEEETVLRAVQTVVDESLARPILVGRPAVIEQRIERLGLRLREGRDFDLVNIDDDARFQTYWRLYLSIMQRKGATPAIAKAIVRSRGTAIAALALRQGDTDAVICGLIGRYQKRVRYMVDILGLDPGVTAPAALTAVINDRGTLFFLDTHVQYDPDAELIVQSTLMAAERLRWFGIKPKVALLSHSMFGSHANASASKMRRACALLRECAPDLEVDGEMHGDAAIDEGIRERAFPESLLRGSANLFVMPNLDSAHIALNLVRTLTDGVVIGPMLLGVRGAAHVLTTSATVRRVVNMTALAAVDAQHHQAMQSRLPL